MNIETKPSKGFFAGAALVLLGAAILLFWELGSANFWVDEFLTRERAQAGLGDVLDVVAEHGSTQAPLFYVTMQLAPGYDETLLRLPVVLTALVGIGLLMALTRALYQDERLAVWGGVMLAVSPYFIFQSRQARAYPFFFLVALLASYFFLRLYQKDRRRWVWGAFVLAMAATYLTHYFSILLTMAQGAFLALVLGEALLKKDRQTFKETFAFSLQVAAAHAVAVLGLVAWVLKVLLREGRDVASVEWITTPDLGDLGITFLNLAQGYNGVFVWFWLPAIVLGAGGLTAGVIAAFARRHENPTDMYWVCLLLVPVGGVFVGSLIIDSFFVDRYFIFVVPAAVLLLLRGWMFLGAQLGPQKLLWQVAPAIIAVCAAIATLNFLATGDYRMYEWQAAGDYVEDHVAPRDGLMVIHRSYIKDVRFYAPSLDLPVVDVPEVAREEKRNLDIDALIAAAAPPDSPIMRLWVVYRNPSVDTHRITLMPDFDPFEPTYTVREGDALLNWLNANRAFLVREYEANGVHVLLFDLTARAGQSPENTAVFGG